MQANLRAQITYRVNLLQLCKLSVFGLFEEAERLEMETPSKSARFVEQAMIQNSRQESSAKNT